MPVSILLDFRLELLDLFEPLLKFCWKENGLWLLHDPVVVEKRSEDQAAGGQFDPKVEAGLSAGQPLPIHQLYQHQPSLNTISLTQYEMF